MFACLRPLLRLSFAPACTTVTAPPNRPLNHSRPCIPAPQQQPGARGRMPGPPGPVWTELDDAILCALVLDFGANWHLVADIFSTLFWMTGVYRRADMCKQRYQALSVRGSMQRCALLCCCVWPVRAWSMLGRRMLVRALAMRLPRTGCIHLVTGC